jgi:hypothetical protein
MGRKNRDKESKDTRESKEVEDDDDVLEEDESTRLQKIDENQLNIMWETRKAMIQYCDDMCIPLCDYLTVNMFDDFMFHLESLQ